MDKKRILLLCAMGILLAAAITLGVIWIMEAAEYAGYKADYVDIAEDVLHSDEDDGMIELVPLSPAPKQNDTLDDPTASAATDPRSTAEPSRPASASNADGKEAAQRVSVDFAALAAQNSDIFMDYQNDLNPLDRNTILFGHNMGSSSSLMFSQLTKFKKQSYWEKHQTFQFDTPDRTGTWQVLAVCHLDVSTLEQFNFLQQDFLSDDSFLDFVQSLKARALYETHVSAPSDGRLLTLVTCDRSDGFGKSGRLLVVAVQIN